jgi:hypothetical protein
MYTYAYEHVQGTYWLYAERALFQVTLAKEEEGRFVWRLYLDKALQVGTEYRVKSEDGGRRTGGGNHNEPKTETPRTI